MPGANSPKVDVIPNAVMLARKLLPGPRGLEEKNRVFLNTDARLVARQAPLDFDRITKGPQVMKRHIEVLMVLALTPLLAEAQEPEVVRNVIVYKQQDRFAGWPANNGIWSWGNEIVVGFILGYHKE